jgi:hypothetical protein
MGTERLHNWASGQTALPNLIVPVRWRTARFHVAWVFAYMSGYDLIIGHSAGNNATFNILRPP